MNTSNLRIPPSPVLAVDLALEGVRALLRVPEAGEARDHAFFLPPADCLPALRGKNFVPGFWQNLCELCGLPIPDRILVCTDEPYGAGLSGPSLLGRLLTAAGPAGAPVQALLPSSPFADMLRLCAIQRITSAPAGDYSTAFVLGLLSQQGVRARTFRQGLTLLYLDRQRLFAALLFRDRVLAFCELPLREICPSLKAAAPHDPGPGMADPAPLLRLLDDFRLGWLPLELAHALGGHVCSVAQLPAEAEGFAPLLATGPFSRLLEGRARLMDSRPDQAAMNACQGLLYGYALLSRGALQKC